MNGPSSRHVQYLIVEEDGSTTILEPLEDADARRTPEERKALLDYLEKTRRRYRSATTGGAEAPQRDSA